MNDSFNQNTLQHYGVKGMRWDQSRRKRRSRTGYQDIQQYKVSDEARARAQARLSKAGTLSVKAATSTMNAVTNFGLDFLDSFFSTAPGSKNSKPKKLRHLDTTEYLEHYGILGMKWGVRRTPEQLGHKPKTSTEKWKYKQLNQIDRLYEKSYRKLDRAYKEDPVDPSILKYKKQLEAQQAKDRKAILDMSFVQVEEARETERSERKEARAKAVKAVGGATMWAARMALIGVRIGGTVAVLNVLSDAGRTAMDFINSPEGQETLKAGANIITKFGNGELTALNIAKDFFSTKASGSLMDQTLSSIDVSGVMPGANYIPPDKMASALKEVNRELDKINRNL